MKKIDFSENVQGETYAAIGVDLSNFGHSLVWIIYGPCVGHDNKYVILESMK